MSLAVAASRRVGPRRPAHGLAQQGTALAGAEIPPVRPTPAAVASALEVLRAALDDGADRWTPEVAEDTRKAVCDLDRRLTLGLDSTVVALVGGTGSGKSSLVNAISGLAFAEVGELRPTTAQPSACVWGDRRPALLDALGVPVDRRIRRESALDGDREDALRGLVLLDLPDTDSVERGHSETVDRILPLVDLLVWVVDPQKYADTVLHERYLRALAGRRDAMLVLVNQVDTVAPAAVQRIAVDVARLLEADGLAGVPVLGTSAVTGAGIADVRALLARVVAAGSVRAWLAAEELRVAAARLGADLGDAAPPAAAALAAEAEAATTALADAAGLATVTAGVRHAVERGASDGPRVGAPSLATAAVVRQRVVRTARRGLSDRWRAAIEQAAGDVADLWTAAGDAVGSVPLPPIAAGRAWRGGAAGVALATLLGVVVGALTGAPVVAAIVGLGGASGVVALLAGARAARRRAAAERAAAYEAHVRAALGDVVDRLLLAPVTGVLAERERIGARVASVPTVLGG